MIALKLAFHVAFEPVSSALRRIDMSGRSHGACPHEAENATNAAKYNATILTMVDISIYLCLSAICGRWFDRPDLPLVSHRTAAACSGAKIGISLLIFDQTPPEATPRS